MDGPARWLVGDGARGYCDDMNSSPSNSNHLTGQLRRAIFRCGWGPTDTAHYWGRGARIVEPSVPLVVLTASPSSVRIRPFGVAAERVSAGSTTVEEYVGEAGKRLWVATIAGPAAAALIEVAALAQPVRAVA